jgi:hypothetical protein
MGPLPRLVDSVGVVAGAVVDDEGIVGFRPVARNQSLLDVALVSAVPWLPFVVVAAAVVLVGVMLAVAVPEVVAALSTIVLEPYVVRQIQTNVQIALETRPKSWEHNNNDDVANVAVDDDLIHLPRNGSMPWLGSSRQKASYDAMRQGR